MYLFLLLIHRSLTAVSHTSAARHPRCEKKSSALVSDTIPHIQRALLLASCHFSQDSSTQLSDAEIKRAIDNISEKFTEAMELMNDAVIASKPFSVA